MVDEVKVVLSVRDAALRRVVVHPFVLDDEGDQRFRVAADVDLDRPALDRGDIGVVFGSVEQFAFDPFELYDGLGRVSQRAVGEQYHLPVLSSGIGGFPRDGQRSGGFVVGLYLQVVQVVDCHGGVFDLQVFDSVQFLRILESVDAERESDAGRLFEGDDGSVPFELQLQYDVVGSFGISSVVGVVFDTGRVTCGKHPCRKEQHQCLKQFFLHLSLVFG